MLEQVVVLRVAAYTGHNDLGLSQEAITQLERAMQILDSIPPDPASRALMNRFEGPDPVYRAFLYNALGEVYYDLGLLDSAATYYRKVFDTWANRRGSAIGSRVLTDGKLFSNLGVAYHLMGRPDSALFYLNRSLRVRAGKRDPDSRLGYAVALNNMARVYQTLGRFDTAIATSRAALEALHRFGDSEFQGTQAVLRYSLAVSFEATARADSALTIYQQAQLSQQGVCNPWVHAMVLGGIGRTLGETGHPDSARAVLALALSLRRTLGARRSIGWISSDIARLHQRSGELDSALSYFSQALARFRESGDQIAEGVTLYDIGHTYRVRHRGLDLSMAKQYFAQAAALRSAVRRYSGTDVNRVSFAEQDVPLFEEWTLAYLAPGEEMGGDSAAAAALATEERGRAQALLDLRRGVGKPEPSVDLITQARELTRTLRTARTPALSYLVTRDTLLIWMVEPSGELKIVRRAISADTLAAWVAGLRQALGVAENAARTTGLWPDARARRLSDTLLPTELMAQLAGANELVLMPHGPLNVLPFAALPTAPDGELLGSRIALRYVPSLAILVEAENRRPRPGTRLVVGNPQMPVVTLSGRTDTLPPLGGAAAEAESVARLLKVERLRGKDEREEAIRRRLPGASIVHLATHGYAYATDAEARGSWVALAPSPSWEHTRRPEQDGLLTVGEVLDDDALKLSADLVVLSACQTALGNLKQAEGTVGLQRAFLARGARTVLVSLWKVNDTATRLLMESFYRHWPGDGTGPKPSKARALRLAQAEVRSIAAFRHPRFWAAFQLVGAR
jgi:CHAT domain-containing protein/tetratricopeptide (TPR) repeat protein